MPLVPIWKSLQEKLYGYEYEAVDENASSLTKATRLNKHRTAIVCLGLSGLILAGTILTFVLFPTLLNQQELPVAYFGQITNGAYVQYRQSHHWHGWTDVTRLIVFGDSWSTTGFSSSGTQPTPANPLGNPEWPGVTSTNGANWVDYLTCKYNKSLLLTANFAAGGATVDEELITSPLAHPFHGVRTQVHDFINAYGDSPLYQWEADDSLFVIWIGTNDVYESNNDTRHFFPKLFQEYAQYTDMLYQHGARNFMFMTVPPIERSPLTRGQYKHYHQLVGDFNQNMTDLAWNFTNVYNDTTTFLFDAHTFLDNMIDDPCFDEQSCMLRETLEICLKYSFGKFETHPDCPYTIYEYLWMNPLHPTTTTHNAIAHAVAAALSAVNATLAEGISR